MQQRKFEDIFISALCVAYSLFHIWIVFYPIPELLQRSFHVCIGMGLIFLLFLNKIDFKFLKWILFCLCSFCFLYLFFEYQEIVTQRGGIPNSTDIIFSIITTLLVLEATRKNNGLDIAYSCFNLLILPFCKPFRFYAK